MGRGWRYAGRGVRMKRSLVVLLILVLIAAAANVPVALLWYRPQRLALYSRRMVVVQGAPAAMHSWPDATPHDRPWPALTQWQSTKVLNHEQIQAYANGFQMTTDRYGWPLPVLIETNRWWPWDDPQWKISTEPELGIRVVWSGLLLNPLIAAASVWLVVFAPLFAARWLVQRRRAREGQCQKCGYPIGVSDRCTECGAELPARAPAGAA